MPVGRELTDLRPEWREPGGSGPEADGSVLVVVGTDAPVSALTLKAMARRAALGLARNGAAAHPSSGDVVLAFATTPVAAEEEPPFRVRGEMPLFPYAARALYAATIQATEEAVVNALVAGRTMTGVNGSRVHALPHDALRDALRRYNRLQE